MVFSRKSLYTYNNWEVVFGPHNQYHISTNSIICGTIQLDALRVGYSASDMHMGIAWVWSFGDYNEEQVELDDIEIPGDLVGFMDDRH